MSDLNGKEEFRFGMFSLGDEEDIFSDSIDWEPPLEGQINLEELLSGFRSSQKAEEEARAVEEAKRAEEVKAAESEAVVADLPPVDAAAVIEEAVPPAVPEAIAAQEAPAPVADKGATYAAPDTVAPSVAADVPVTDLPADVAPAFGPPPQPIQPAQPQPQPGYVPPGYTPNPWPQNPSQPGGYDPHQPYGWQYQGYGPQAGPYTNLPEGPAGKRRKKGSVVAVAVVLLLLAGIAVGAYYVATHWNPFMLMPGPAQSSASDKSQSAPSGAAGGPQMELDSHPGENDPAEYNDGRLSTKEIARRIQPAVVGIIQYDSPSTRDMDSSQGSGILLSDDGYIVTNSHVIEGATYLEVVLSTGDTFDATVVGVDKRTDLAVIKIDASGLPYAKFGNSDQVEVGDKVIAIGNPGGVELAGTVTQGIISALNRSVHTSQDGYSLNCLQTDAAISPGNSGGPLVNEYGQVIAITTAKIVDTQYEGIAFAIPINNAKPIVDDLIQNGRVTGRVRLGISARIVDPRAIREGLLPAGIQVEQADPNADIAKKGLIKGDIITAIDGKPVANFDDVAEALVGKKPGDLVTLSVTRPGQTPNAHQTMEIAVAVIADTVN